MFPAVNKPRMSFNQASWRLRKAQFTGRSMYVTLAALLGLMTIGASGQISEVGIAAKIADSAIGRDINWLILFVTALVVGLCIYLVKALMELAKDSQTAAVETAMAIQRLCDLIEKDLPPSNEPRRKPH